MNLENKSVIKYNKDIIFNYIKNSFIELKKSVAHVSSEVVEWVGIIFLLGATVPTLFGLMLGISDNTPPIDVVLILWAALSLFFIKAAIKKDILNMVTIGLGFVAQATIIALIFFK